MEIILALVVAIAVIIFGALISMGNERQRRAIDGLREQVELWAIQDIRLKRERLSRSVHVDDPIAWLNKIVAKIYGSSLDLTQPELLFDPPALVCSSRDHTLRIALSSFSPKEIRRLNRNRRNRFSKLSEHLVLVDLGNASGVELSVLNAGIFFDLELPIAWKALTGQGLERTDRIWLYFINKS